MLENEAWKQLIELVENDKKSSIISDNIKSIQDLIQSNNLASKTVTSNLDQIRKSLTDHQKIVHTHELQLNTLKDAEAKKRSHLDVVRDQKEFKALEKEILLLSFERTKIEETIVQLWFKIDELKTTLISEEQKAKDLLVNFCDDSREKQNNITQLQQEIDSLTQQHDTILQSLPNEWITQYEHMKHGVQDPIVPLINGSCSSCFYSIPHQDLARIKKSLIIICRSCYRFIFFDEKKL